MDHGPLTTCHHHFLRVGISCHHHVLWVRIKLLYLSYIYGDCLLYSEYLVCCGQVSNQVVESVVMPDTDGANPVLLVDDDKRSAHLIKHVVLYNTWPTQRGSRCVMLHSGGYQLRLDQMTYVSIQHAPDSAVSGATHLMNKHQQIIGYTFKLATPLIGAIPATTATVHLMSPT